MNLEAEFLKAFEEFSDALYRHCYFRVFDRERAKDFVQEAFTKTWDYLARGGEIKQFRPFLYRTAQNLIIDEARKKKPVYIEDLPPAGLKELSVSNEAEMKIHIDAKRIFAALKDLPDSYREVLTLRYVDDFSPKEIAGLLGLSENVVSVRIHRGINHLRSQFHHEHE